MYDYKSYSANNLLTWQIWYSPIKHGRWGYVSFKVYHDTFWMVLHKHSIVFDDGFYYYLQYKDFWVAVDSTFNVLKQNVITSYLCGFKRQRCNYKIVLRLFKVLLFSKFMNLWIERIIYHKNIQKFLIRSINNLFAIFKNIGN